VLLPCHGLEGLDRLVSGSVSSPRGITHSAFAQCRCARGSLRPDFTGVTGVATAVSLPAWEASTPRSSAFGHCELGATMPRALGA
jgi:hypothetical protein